MFYTIVFQNKILIWYLGSRWLGVVEGSDRRVRPMKMNNFEEKIAKFMLRCFHTEFVLIVDCLHKSLQLLPQLRCLRHHGWIGLKNPSNYHWWKIETLIFLLSLYKKRQSNCSSVFLNRQTEYVSALFFIFFTLSLSVQFDYFCFALWNTLYNPNSLETAF